MARDPIVLSAEGLGRCASIAADDFSFIGNGFNFHCTAFQAAFISPRVHQMLLEDRTVNSFLIECQTGDIEFSRIFSLFESLMNGLAIEPSEAERFGVREVATVLGNPELLSNLDDTEIELTNVCSMLRSKSHSGAPADREIAFAALHFCELDSDGLKDLDLSTVEGILSSPLLRLVNEDWLLTFICGMEIPLEVLLRYVRTDYLSGSGISMLLDCLSPLRLDPMIWESLCRRLILPVCPIFSGCEPMEVSGTKVICDRPGVGSVGLGIISDLTRLHNVNVHTGGIVTITSNGRSCGGELKDVADFPFALAQEPCYWSGSEPGMWICWDFHAMRIHVTNYTIAAGWLESWSVETSVDGEDWSTIDVQMGRADFRPPSMFPPRGVASFAVGNSAPARFIRVTDTGGAFHVAWFAVEFFGELLL
jgi:hypothetical protein